MKDKCVIDAFNKYKEAVHELALAILGSEEVDKHLAIVSVIMMEKTGCLVAANIGVENNE